MTRTETNLDGWAIEMSSDRSGLPGFLPQHGQLHVDGAECINDNFPFHGLNGVNHYCNAAFVCVLKGLNTTGSEPKARVRLSRAVPYLLRVNINIGQPAPKARVRVVPAHHNFWPAISQCGVTSLCYNESPAQESLTCQCEQAARAFSLETQGQRIPH